MPAANGCEGKHFEKALLRTLGLHLKHDFIFHKKKLADVTDTHTYKFNSLNVYS